MGTRIKWRYKFLAGSFPPHSAKIASMASTADETCRVIDQPAPENPKDQALLELEHKEVDLRSSSSGELRNEKGCALFEFHAK